jgi:carbon monoxide dehydrogenase subunit G
MELSGQRRLAVDRNTAWRALNDPQILKASIPGCESIEKTGDNEYAVAVATVLGPVRAKFRGKLRLEDVVAPERYTLRFEGEGGAAGFAKGSARVTLSETGGETILDYVTNAQVGGRIAQVGSRLVDSAAKKLADDFFAAFEKVVSGTPSGAASRVVPDTRFFTPFRAALVAVILIALVAAIAFILR